MAELFTLQLTDEVETADFLNSTNYKVQDGGFDIGMPTTTRELSEIRPGFFRLAKSQREYRKASIKFSIHGATRTALLSALSKLERIISSIEEQEWITDSTRGQLSYAFDGATQMTYFEVYAGDFVMPANMLSIEVAHGKDASGFFIKDVELRLFMSPVGYALSIYSEPTYEVPLYNPTVGAKQTGGVNIKNPGAGNYSYVQIDNSDVSGALPYVTKLQLIGQSSGYTAWERIFIGKVHSPFPSKIVYDDDEVAGGTQPGSTTSNAAANNGQYRTVTKATSHGGSLFSEYAWSVPTGMKGMFYAFLCSYSTMISDVQFAFGVDDYVKYGIRQVSEYVQLSDSTTEHFPIAPVQLPPVGLEVEDYGTLHEDLWMGVFTRAGVPITYNWDFVHLLPMNNGLRVWVKRVDPSHTNWNVDNNWKGIAYNREPSTGKVWSGFHTMMTPIQLSPGKTQRLYFCSQGKSGSASERARSFQVRLWAVPTFSTLAY